MKTYLVDLEADGLLDTVSHIHCVVFKELNEENYEIFSDDTPRGRPLSEMAAWADANCKAIVGHNWVRYDVKYCIDYQDGLLKQLSMIL